jgi:cytochrome c-type biogenesis protein CcmH
MKIYNSSITTGTFGIFWLKRLAGCGSSYFYAVQAKLSVTIIAALCLLLLSTLNVHAQLPTPAQSQPSPELAARLKKLESELRCLVCQNQTLAESPAGLASDLRREVRILIDEGKSDAEIKAFLRARYGDFVLYKPPVDRKTYALWFGPFLLLAAGAFTWIWVARRRRLVVAEPTKLTVSDNSADSLARARELLEGDSNDRR